MELDVLRDEPEVPTDDENAAGREPRPSAATARSQRSSSTMWNMTPIALTISNSPSSAKSGITDVRLDDRHAGNVGVPLFERADGRLRDLDPDRLFRAEDLE